MIVVLARDLIIATRISSAAERAGQPVMRVDAPAELPDPSNVGLLFVDWGDRESGWPELLLGWLARATQPDRPRIVLFGPHTDLDAHRAAREAGLGPMIARSRLVGHLSTLIGAD